MDVLDHPIQVQEPERHFSVKLVGFGTFADGHTEGAHWDVFHLFQRVVEDSTLRSISSNHGCRIRRVAEVDSDAPDNAVILLVCTFGEIHHDGSGDSLWM